jgi:ribosomal protein L12E/L44/L45/RPP1/RPP2
MSTFDLAYLFSRNPASRNPGSASRAHTSAIFLRDSPEDEDDDEEEEDDEGDEEDDEEESDEGDGYSE